MKRWLRLIVCSFFLFWTSAAHAHDGPHGVDMVAEVKSAQINGNTVAIEVLVINVGGPLVLTGLKADGALAVDLVDVYLNFAEEVVVSATLDFDGAPPRAFLLVLDFGVVGHGAITVTPQSPSR